MKIKATILLSTALVLLIAIVLPFSQTTAATVLYATDNDSAKEIGDYSTFPAATDIDAWKADGTWEARVEFMKSLGHDKIDPALIERAKQKEQGNTGNQPFGTTLPTAWQGGMPTEGDAKVVVFLVEFPDYSHDLSITAQDIEEQYFGIDNTENYPYESLTNYYERSSYGKLNIDGDVYGWYKAKYDRADYNTLGRDVLMREVMEHFDAVIDYSKYDADGNGEIDCAYLLFSGDNEGWGSMWWSYMATWYDDTFKVDGKGLKRYIFLHDLDNRTVIHETGHALGLPDYYNYETSFGGAGMGSFDMMDNNVGDHNAFSKLLLGWIEPVIVTDDIELNLDSFDVKGDAVLITSSYAGTVFSEYFLVEFLTGELNFMGSVGIQPGFRILHVNAELNDDGTDFKYSNSYTHYNGKLLDTLKADGTSVDIRAFENYLFREGHTLSPYTYPGTDMYGGKYSGINISNFQVKAEYALLDISILQPISTKPQIQSSTIKAGDLMVSNIFDSILTFGANVYAGSTFDSIELMDENGISISSIIKEYNPEMPNQIRLYLPESLNTKSIYKLHIPADSIKNSSGFGIDELTINFRTAPTPTIIDQEIVWNDNTENENAFLYDNRLMLTSPNGNIKLYEITYTRIPYEGICDFKSITFSSNGDLLDEKTLIKFTSDDMQNWSKLSNRIYQIGNDKVLYYRFVERNSVKYHELRVFDLSDNLLWESVMHAPSNEMISDFGVLATTDDFIDLHYAIPGEGYSANYYVRRYSSDNGAFYEFEYTPWASITGYEVVGDSIFRVYAEQGNATDGQLIPLIIEKGDLNYNSETKSILTRIPYLAMPYTVPFVDANGDMLLFYEYRDKSNERNVYVVCFDQNGTLKSEIKLENVSGSIAKISQDDDGFLIIVSQSKPADRGTGWRTERSEIVRLDSNLNVLWKRAIGNFEWSISGTSVVRLQNSRYAFSYSRSNINHLGNYGELQIQISEPVIYVKVSEGGFITPLDIFGVGENAIVTATPKPGYTFDGWYENGVKVASEPEYSFVAATDVEIMANFVRDIETPEISVQPVDQIAEIGDNVTLTVEANVSEGTLSYQWYQNTVKTNSGGISIEGAIENSFTAPTDIPGMRYYYCLVTNTIVLDTEEQTASVTSDVASVFVMITSQDRQPDFDGTTWNIPADSTEILELSLEGWLVDNVFYDNTDDSITWTPNTVFVKPEAEPFNAIIKFISEDGTRVRYCGAEKVAKVSSGTSYDGKTWIIPVGIQATMELKDYTVIGVLGEVSYDALSWTSTTIIVSDSTVVLNVIVKLEDIRGNVKYVGIERP